MRSDLSGRPVPKLSEKQRASSVGEPGNRLVLASAQPATPDSTEQSERRLVIRADRPAEWEPGGKTKSFSPICPCCGRRGMIRIRARIFGCHRCWQVCLLTVGARGLVMVPMAAKPEELAEIERRVRG